MTQVVALGSALAVCQFTITSCARRAPEIAVRVSPVHEVNLSHYTRYFVSYATLWRASGCCTAGERHHQAHLRIRGRAGCRAAARRPAAVGRLPHLRHELPAGRRRQHRHQRARTGGHCISKGPAMTHMFLTCPARFRPAGQQSSRWCSRWQLRYGLPAQVDAAQQYNTAASGYAPLRQWAEAHVEQMHGMPSPHDVIITTGSNHAVDVSRAVRSAVVRMCKTMCRRLPAADRMQTGCGRRGWQAAARSGSIAHAQDAQAA